MVLNQAKCFGSHHYSFNNQFSNLKITRIVQSLSRIFDADIFLRLFSSLSLNGVFAFSNPCTAQMANRTAVDAFSVHGGDPQLLIEKVARSRIYESRFWKEECFGLSSKKYLFFFIL